jgi:hypothetical protein
VETHNSEIRDSGWDDSTIGGKFCWNPGDKGAVSLMPTFVLPTGTRSIAEHVFQAAEP